MPRFEHTVAYGNREYDLRVPFRTSLELGEEEQVTQTESVPNIFLVESNEGNLKRFGVDITSYLFCHNGILDSFVCDHFLGQIKNQ